MLTKLDQKHLKIIYRIMAVIVGITWGSILLFYCYKFVMRKYFYPLDYKELIVEYSDSYGFDRALVFSIVKVESGFDKNAQSNKGATGLMQITKNTADFIAGKLNVESYDLLDPRTNINFGCFYLKYLYLRFDNLDTAIVAYNAGEGNVKVWLESDEYSKDNLTLYNIPFKETKEYKEKIDKTFINYKKLYKNFLDK